MTDSLATTYAATPAPGPPQHVQVYGNDHSPWVQAVLLGLREKRVSHTQVNVPPLEVFLRSGVVMPAAKLDAGEWRLDSERILVALGFSEVDEEARRALQVGFGVSALRRTESAWQFWQRFSLVRDGHPSRVRRLRNHFLRAFTMFHFFTVITTARRRFQPLPPMDAMLGKLLVLQERLAPEAEYFGGNAPDTLDFQLFGLVQMCASIPGEPLALVRHDAKLERLRGWIAAMQRRFADHPHLYSAPYFEPVLPGPSPAPALDRLFYWCGAASMWLAFPLTLPLTLYWAQRVRRQGLVTA